MSRAGDWNCRSCNHLNFQRRDSCQRCGEPKAGGGGLSSGPDVRPGDWYCAIGNCGAHNFASRSSCFKCGGYKLEDTGFGGGGFGSASGVDSSRLGWKSGDWMLDRNRLARAWELVVKLFPRQRKK